MNLFLSQIQSFVKVNKNANSKELECLDNKEKYSNYFFNNSKENTTNKEILAITDKTFDEIEKILENI